ncbi:MAG: ATP-binding protein [Acidobacteriota bacterium]|nr:ATP-binding protein [Acidobacteriota bacterium]
MKRIHEAWKKRPIVWLAGVRRVGKTTLARMLADTVHLNCDLPSDARRLEDPELFLGAQTKGAVVVLDEIHRLPDPSRILKIAADVYPQLRILATGSSTLAATRKFRDTLTGRKVVIHLSPVLWSECRDDFGIADLDQRLHYGGLPEFLLSPVKDESLFSEWMDSFYARDIQELFAVRERAGFLNLFRLLLRQSGGLADYSALSRECDISRQTVKTYLEALSIACAVIAVSPFHGGGRQELVKRPKVYGFDTGFVAYARGWTDIRDDDRGLLWEHLVLDSLRAKTGGEGLHHWRDKSGREVDFVVRRGREVDAVECKINPDRFDAASLAVFREAYPRGRNLLVCPGVDEPYERRIKGLVVRVVGTQALME